MYTRFSPVYPLGPGIPRRVSSRGPPFSSLHSLTLSPSPSLSGSHSQFPLRETAEYSNFVVLGKSDKCELDRPRGRVSFPFYAENKRTPIPLVLPECHRSFASLVRFASRTANVKCSRSIRGTDLIHLDNPYTIYLARCVDLPPGSTCYRLKIRFIRPT